MRRIAHAPLALALVGMAWGAPTPLLWSADDPTAVSVSVAEGYSHYDATELNEVLQLLENLTRETAGLNPYAVNGFSGHPATQLTLSVRKGPWRIGVETEFWTQTFAQSDIPFDLSDNQRTDRITCQDLYANPPASLAGCIQAREEFFFLPVTAQVSWMPEWRPGLRAGLGYALGILGGSASLELSTTYVGEGAAPADKIRFDIEPDPLVNPVQKWFAALEWTPWTWLGLESRAGWRRSRAGGFTMRNPTGTSRVFEAAFNDPQAGDQMWVRWPATAPSNRALWIGPPQDAQSHASPSGHQLVQGVFDGWFATLALNFHWSLS